MKKFIDVSILLFLSLCIVFSLTSCKGINRGEGYVFQWSEDTNYVVITISDTEYIHFLMDSGIGEWVTSTGSSPVAIGSIYYPRRNANAYRLVCYNCENDSDFAKLFLLCSSNNAIIFGFFFKAFKACCLYCRMLSILRPSCSAICFNVIF